MSAFVLSKVACKTLFTADAVVHAGFFAWSWNPGAPPKTPELSSIGGGELAEPHEAGAAPVGAV